MKCGLLGRKLGHSYSPQIHSHLGNYTYGLFEKEPEDLEHFLRSGVFSGINVTVPYKKAVIPYLDRLSPLAEKLGAVNTVVRRNGQLIGHNTDYFGFQYMVHKSGLDPKGKKCLVLGSGGASGTALAVLQEMGALPVVISRTGTNHYGNLHLHRDAALLVNTTPVGMYPHTGISPIDLDLFPRLEGVLDVVYNPCRTQLLLDAQARGIPSLNGLWMLVAQAKEAAEWFTGTTLPDEIISHIHHLLRMQTENIILIGMPGCGKSTVGALLAEACGRRFVDADAQIESLAGKSIPQIFEEDGEPVFRAWETEALAQLGKESGLVIATGGGCVTQPRNEPLLRQNGTILWLQRDLSLLPTDGRPLSQSTKLSQLYRTREPMYRKFSDLILSNSGTPEETVRSILALWEECL